MICRTEEHKYEEVSEDASNLCDVASPLLLPALQDVIDTEPVKEISSKISAIVDGIPALLSLLDTVAEIHPFIKRVYISSLLTSLRAILTFYV